MKTILKDILQLNLKVCFCGTAAGNKSAEIGAYYAGRGNKFWETLFKIGITPTKLFPKDYPKLLKYDIGLTDIAKYAFGNDDQINKSEYDIDEFRRKIEQFQPKLVCFNGKTAAKVYFNTKKVNYGLQTQTIGTTNLFVAPSTSGSANGYWDINYWLELSKILDE